MLREEGRRGNSLSAGAYRDAQGYDIGKAIDILFVFIKNRRLLRRIKPDGIPSFSWGSV